ncbi:hypothetical protein FOZ62_025292, partial [Perkinsus olseni]
LLGMLYPLVEITNYAIIGRCGYFKCRDPTRPTNPLDIAPQPEDGHHHPNNRHHGLLGETLSLVGGIAAADPVQTTWHNDIEFKRALGRVLSKFFGVYFAFFAISGVIILATGAILLPSISASSTPDDRRSAFFWLLALFPLAGMFVFHMVPPSPRSDVIPGTPPPVISAFSSVAFVVKHKTFLIIMPLIVVGGMVDAYFYGEFTLFVATPYLGQRAIPFIIGCLFFTQGLASWAIGMLVYKGHLRRRTTILIGAAALSSFFVFRILLFYTNRGIIENFRQDPSSPDKWRKNQDPTPWEFTMIFALTILLAMGRAAYDSQIPAVLHHHYQLTEFHVIAVGNYKAYRSMGSSFINALDLWALDKVKGIYSDERTFPTTSVVLLIVVVATYLPLGFLCLRSSLLSRTAQRQ